MPSFVQDWMRGKRGGGWAGVALPFSDAFASRNGKWIGTGFAVAGGTATVTPSLSGVELVTNGGFDANTSGWSGSQGNIASVAGGQAGNCCQLTKTGGTSQQAIQLAIALSLNLFYRYSGYVKSGTSGNENALIQAQREGGTYATDAQISLTSSASWAQAGFSFIPPWASYRFNFNKNTATDGTMLFDTASIQAFLMASCMASVLSPSANITAQAKVTCAAGTQAGLVVNLDNPANPQNFILPYLDGSTLGAMYGVLDEFVAGVRTNKIRIPVTYGAGKILKFIGSGTTGKLYYDGAQVGTDQAMTANLHKRHGLFSTLVTNTFDDFSLTNP